MSCIRYRLEIPEIVAPLPAVVRNIFINFHRKTRPALVPAETTPITKGLGREAKHSPPPIPESYAAKYSLRNSLWWPSKKPSCGQASCTLKEGFQMSFCKAYKWVKCLCILQRRYHKSSSLYLEVGETLEIESGLYAVLRML